MLVNSLGDKKVRWMRFLMGTNIYNFFFAVYDFECPRSRTFNRIILKTNVVAICCRISFEVIANEQPDTFQP